MPSMMGDYNQDGHTDASDVPVLIAALADLNAYKTAYNLTDAGLLSFGDLDGDHAITNADLQALLAILSPAGGSGSGSSSGGNAQVFTPSAATAVAAVQSTIQTPILPSATVPSGANTIPPRAWNAIANSAAIPPRPLQAMMPLTVDDLMATGTIIRNRHAHAEPRETLSSGNDDLLA